MAQLVVAAAGAAVGSMFGAPQLGWVIGSMLGSAFAPKQKSEGPRLTDLSVSSSAYGTPIPYVQGHPRGAGQIIWASKKRDIATTTEQGKGGGSEYTSYTYEVDLLIELSDNVIAGVSRVWGDGKLIWSSLSDGTLNTLMASGGTTAWQRMTVYTGSPTQLPDPTYEAAVGTANAPAYRGRGSVFIQALQLGGGGNLPNLTFEVFTDGSTGTGTVASLQHFDLSSGVEYEGTFPQNPSNYTLRQESVPAAVGPGWTLQTGRRNTDTPTYSTTNYSHCSAAFAVLGSGGLRLYNYGTFDTQYAVAQTTMDASFAAAGDFTVEIVHDPDGDAFFSGSSNGYVINTPTWGVRNVYTGARAYQFLYAGGGGLTGPNRAGRTRVRVTRKSGILRMFYDGVLVATAGAVDNTALGGSGSLSIGGAYGTAPTYVISDTVPGIYDEFLFVSGLALSTASYTPEAVPYADASTITLSEYGNLTIGTVVSNLCLRTGLAASQFDVSALASITKPVRAMAISQVSSTRTVLDTLAACYFFEAVLSDKIYFRPRGGAAVATLAYDDLGVSVDGGSGADPLALRQANELELPAQIALTYSNVDGDYQTDTQYSDRLLTGQDSTGTMQVPLGFTAAEAKAIVDAMLMDQAAGVVRTSISLGLQHTRLEPTDVVVLTGEDGSTYRMRLLKRTDADGVLSFDAVLDDATVLTQAGVTSGGTTPQTSVAALPNTTLELLDIPILRDADDRPGHYVAVKGDNPSWHSAGLYQSLDTTTYSLNTTINSQAVMGGCSTTLGNWTGGNVFDEINTVTVAVGLGQLASVTRDDLLNSQSVNAALVGSELIQFRDATLLSTGVYQLGGLLRGRRGTEWAMTGHAASERFVQLSLTGMRFIELQTSELGKLRYYKAASAGQRLSSVTAKSITPLGVGLEPFSPVDARVDRTAADHVVSWRRRTRLSGRITGPLAWSHPLGEATESYEVEIFSSLANATAGTPVLRTVTATASNFTYTSAQRATDGTGSAVVYLRVYQLSATVGRGYPLITSA